MKFNGAYPHLIPYNTLLFRFSFAPRVNRSIRESVVFSFFILNNLNKTDFEIISFIYINELKINLRISIVCAFLVSMSVAIPFWSIYFVIILTLVLLIIFISVYY